MKIVSFVYGYIKHWLKSTGNKGIATPFVSELMKNVISVKALYYPYVKIEKLREQLLLSKKTIEVLDLGANKGLKKSKSLSKIAKDAAKSPKYAQLLFRLVNHFQPTQIIELGTSLGISTAYLASANTKTTVISMEGCPETAKIAQQNFKQLKIKNVEQVVGNFDDILPKVLSTKGKLDFVFFDGNHRKEATLNYFMQCLKLATENSVFVVDDINWSKEMKEAWEEIKKNKQVTITVDFYFLGIVFFRKEQAKQHLSIRF